MAISTITAQAGKHPDAVRPDLIRHLIINSLRSIKVKFGKRFGEVVIATDGRHYWRKKIFPQYKGNRKADREKTDFDWPMIFGAINTTKEELKEYFPYKVIDIDQAEADDIIATLCMHKKPEELTLIVSNDHDFNQLLRYKNVYIYRTLADEMITVG